MDEQARGSLEQYSHTFGKYLSDKDGEKKFTEEERLMRERAKKANRIYKQVCEDLQLDACFFSNFGEWSEYVEGKMSDAEFQGHAITQAQQMMANRTECIPSDGKTGHSPAYIRRRSLFRLPPGRRAAFW